MKKIVGGMLKKLLGVWPIMFMVFVAGCTTPTIKETTTTTIPEETTTTLPPETTTITTSTTTTTTTIVVQTKEFTIEADDGGFYPSGTVTVNKGDNVKITFKVRTSGTYFGGLDFRSSVWGDTGTVKPGESTIVEFTADKTFTFTSYWPVSNVKKAAGQVIVG